MVPFPLVAKMLVTSRLYVPASSEPTCHISWESDPANENPLDTPSPVRIARKVFDADNSTLSSPDTPNS